MNIDELRTHVIGCASLEEMKIIWHTLKALGEVTFTRTFIYETVNNLEASCGTWCSSTATATMTFGEFCREVQKLVKPKPEPYIVATGTINTVTVRFSRKAFDEQVNALLAEDYKLRYFKVNTVVFFTGEKEEIGEIYTALLKKE
ncbi:MAG: hypothetical protein OQK82_04605 [Candidatus Pacearchaeota archaeon]|nr:hypothetical protein [Candidatus Pacearchaeota archaeon]